MKRIVILVLAAMMAGLCACSAQTVWETVGGGCVRESDGASSVICVRLPQDAVEEVLPRLARSTSIPSRAAGMRS